jgi:hypothetical protein
MGISSKNDVLPERIYGLVRPGKPPQEGKRFSSTCGRNTTKGASGTRTKFPGKKNPFPWACKRQLRNSAPPPSPGRIFPGICEAFENPDSCAPPRARPLRLFFSCGNFSGQFVRHPFRAHGPGITRIGLQNQRASFRCRRHYPKDIKSIAGG